MFKAHSTRATSSTKAAMAGMTVEEMLQAADWSGKGIFQKFYYRPKHSGAYGLMVLTTKASKSHVDMETDPFDI